MKLKEKINRKRVSLNECGELTDKTVFINRVAKVVKGGRRFSFSALIVTGDGRGHVGVGLGKAQEVPEAIRKGAERARSNLVRVPIQGSTIPYDVIGKYGAASVVLKPAAPGTGVIAGSVVRAILDAAGIKDIRSKCIGSSNPGNILQATLQGLLSLREPEIIAGIRGVSLEDLGYQAY